MKRTQIPSIKKLAILSGFLLVACSTTASAQALSSPMISTNKAYVKCLVQAFSQQAGKQRVTRSTLTSACKAQEKAYYDAVYNQNPGLETRFKGNNARAAVRRIKSKTFRTFGVK